MVPQWITGWAWRSVGKRPESPLPESTHILSTAWLGMGFTVAFDVEVPADENKSALYKLGENISPDEVCQSEWAGITVRLPGTKLASALAGLKSPVRWTLDLANIFMVSMPGYGRPGYGFCLSGWQLRAQQLKQLSSLKKLRLHCQRHLQHELR